MRLKKLLEAQPQLGATDKLMVAILKRLALVEAETAFELILRPQDNPEWPPLATEVVREVDALAILITDAFKRELQEQYRSISAQKKFAVESARATMGIKYEKGKNKAPYENYKNAIPGYLGERNAEIVKKLDLSQDIHVSHIARLLKGAYKSIDDTKLTASLNRLELQIHMYQRAGTEASAIFSQLTAAVEEGLHPTDGKISADEIETRRDYADVTLGVLTEEYSQEHSLEPLYPLFELNRSGEHSLIAAHEEKQTLTAGLMAKASTPISRALTPIEENSGESSGEESEENFQHIDWEVDREGHPIALIDGLNRFSLLADKSIRSAVDVPAEVSSFRMKKEG